MNITGKDELGYALTFVRSNKDLTIKEQIEAWLDIEDYNSLSPTLVSIRNNILGALSNLQMLEDTGKEKYDKQVKSPDTPTFEEMKKKFNKEYNIYINRLGKELGL